MGRQVAWFWSKRKPPGDLIDPQKVRHKCGQSYGRRRTNDEPVKTVEKRLL